MKYKKYLSILSFGLLLGSLAPMQTVVAAAKNVPKVEQKAEQKKVAAKPATSKKQAPKPKQKKEEKTPQQIAYEQWEASQAEKKKLAELAAAPSLQSSSSKQEVAAKIVAPEKLEIPQKQESKLEQKQKEKQEPVVLPNKLAAIPPALPAVIKTPADIAFAAGDIETLKALGIKDSMLRLRMKYQIPGRKLDAKTIAEIENKIGYTFQNKDLLKQALTSRAENPLKNYEALETLGDKKLAVYLIEMLLDINPMAKEGDLSDGHQAIDSQEPMAALCLYLGLHKYIQNTESIVPISMLCDIIESLICALYKDGGDEIAKDFVFRFFMPMTKNCCPLKPHQIIDKAKKEFKISYDIISSYLLKINIKDSTAAIKLRPTNISDKDDPVRLTCYLAERAFIETELSEKYKKQLAHFAIDPDYQPLTSEELALEKKRMGMKMSPKLSMNEASSEASSSSSNQQLTELSPLENLSKEEEILLDQPAVIQANLVDIAFTNGNIESLTNGLTDLNISKLNENALKEIEIVLSYTFKKKDLLIQALTTKEQNSVKNCAGLKFLGKNILNATITEMLLQNYKDADREQLTAMRQALVSHESLAALSVRLGLQEYVQHNESTLSIPTLSDIIESLIGALYRDGNLKTTQSFVLKFFLPMIKNRPPLMPDNMAQFVRLATDADYQPLNNEEVLLDFSWREGLKENARVKLHALMGILGAKSSYSTQARENDSGFQCTLEMNYKDPRTQGIGLNKKAAEEEAAQKAYSIIQRSIILPTLNYTVDETELLNLDNPVASLKDFCLKHQVSEPEYESFFKEKKGNAVFYTRIQAPWLIANIKGPSESTENKACAAVAKKVILLIKHLLNHHVAPKLLEAIKYPQTTFDKKGCVIHYCRCLDMQEPCIKTNRCEGRVVDGLKLKTTITLTNQDLWMKEFSGSKKSSVAEAEKSAANKALDYLVNKLLKKEIARSVA